MRLGYSWRISWGGSPMFFKYNPDLPVQIAGTVRRLRAEQQRRRRAPSSQISDERWYAYVPPASRPRCSSIAIPTSTSRSPSTALLGGAGFDAIPNHFRIEANGGYFDRGTNPLFFGTAAKGR